MDASLLARFAGLIRIVKLHAIDDSGAQQKAQLSLSRGGLDGVEETVDDAPRLGEYGFFSCPPDGSEAVALFLAGRRSNPVIIATGTLAQRPKNLAPGEAMLMNLLTGAFLRATADGKLTSEAPDWAHTGDQHVSGTGYAAHMIPADGATGTFTTVDGKTVTVTHGIITRIV